MDQNTSESRNIKFPVSGFKVQNRNLLDTLLSENLVENTVNSASNYYNFQTETLELRNEILVVFEKENAIKDD